MTDTKITTGTRRTMNRPPSKRPVAGSNPAGDATILSTNRAIPEPTAGDLGRSESSPIVSQLLHGDCLEVMAWMPSASVDAIVTDPPYGLGFMGKHWDHGVPGVDFWTEMLRVAKPGAHLLAFGGTRTVHRITTAIEDAGWEIRDCLVWAYASGFPKSLNLDGEWKGWGTALKPAWEPIVMARKPLIGSVARNVLEHGTGALNIDVCRIEATGNRTFEREAGERSREEYRTGTTVGAAIPSDLGRWPSNLLLTDAELFDVPNPGVVGSGEVTSSGEAHVLRRGGTTGAGMGSGSSAAGNVLDATYGDSGTYARFFLVPKPARSEREPKVRGQLAERRVSSKPDGRQWDIPGSKSADRENVHPTVKPLHLMRHLVRLVTPPGGIVLDPFLGSGTTALAAEQEGFRWIGVEREAEYVEIARARLNGTQRGLGL